MSVKMEVPLLERVNGLGEMVQSVYIKCKINMSRRRHSIPSGEEEVGTKVTRTSATERSVYGTTSYVPTYGLSSFRLRRDKEGSSVGTKPYTKGLKNHLTS